MTHSVKRVYFSSEDIEFLRLHASTKGSVYCAKHLNRSVGSIISKCKANSIILKKKRELNNDQDPLHLSSIVTPEAAYTLGFIWGDGTINGGRRVVIKIKEEDGLALLPIFNVANEWNYQIQEARQLTWSNCFIYTSLFKSMYDFLSENNYHNKSGGSPQLILSKIPYHLIPLFFRGLSDADGCFYVGKNNTIRQYCLTSCINQDWKFLTDILDKLDIKYRVHRKVKQTKKGTMNSFSIVRFTGADNITKWGAYIYASYGEDGIGLPRKHSKYIECFRVGRNFGKLL